MADQTDPSYKDPNAPIEARVKDLLSRMTLQEKAAQMAQIERSSTTPTALTTHSVGSILSAGGSAPSDQASAAAWADMIDAMQHWALSSRLGIPIIYGSDAVHGNNNLFGATIFPHNVGLGATRDGELAKSIGVATALEVRACGIHYAFAPCVAVCRDPRWGRCFESYSEDPEIVRMMTPIVSGLQGTPPPGHPSGYPFIAGSNNVIACAKHFIGDGGTEKGKNEGNTVCSFDDLERIHMVPYLDCLDQGVCTVMASYTSWNGRPLHADQYLITDILKDKLGFKGFVISDWEGIDRLTTPQGSNYRYCVSASINAGIDMIMVPHRYDMFLKDLLYLVESGDIPMSRIDDAVERILRVKFIAGLFEKPFSDRALLSTVGCEEHRELARKAVRKSLVLLKNGKDHKKSFLPLDRNAKRILVTGTHADNIGYQCGGWTITWYGGSGKITTASFNLFSQAQSYAKFDGTNFSEWNEQILFSLGILDLDMAITIDEPAAITDTSSEDEIVFNEQWSRSNRLALMFMRMCVAPNVKTSLPETTKAKEFLNNIKDRFRAADKSLAGKLMADLTTMRFDGTRTMNEHIIEMTNLAAKLRVLGMTVDDSFVVQFVLNSLPPDYGPFQINYNTIKDKWNVNDLQSMLVQEEARLKQQNSHVNKGHVANLTTKGAGFKKKAGKGFNKGPGPSHQGEPQSSAVKKEKNDKCFFCKKKGHIQKDCHKRKAWFEKKGIPYNPQTKSK